MLSPLRQHMTNSCWWAGCSLSPPSFYLTTESSPFQTGWTHLTATALQNSCLMAVLAQETVCVYDKCCVCGKSGHNHGEAEALTDPWKALYICICGFCNWAPPFCKETDLTGPVARLLCWYLYVCVTSNVYGSCVTLRLGHHVGHGHLVWLCPPLPKPAGWWHTNARCFE